MRQRRETVEHPFGTMKMRMGATHFLTKRLPRVATEMALHVLSYNPTRAMNIMGIQPLLAAMGVPPAAPTPSPRPAPQETGRERPSTFGDSGLSMPYRRRGFLHDQDPDWYLAHGFRASPDPVVLPWLSWQHRGAIEERRDDRRGPTRCRVP